MTKKINDFLPSDINVEDFFLEIYSVLNIHDIVSITDSRGTITFVNDKFCEISGYKREELMGSSHRLIKSGLHPPEFYQDMWRTIASGKVWCGDLCNRAKDGRIYWVATTISPVLDLDGQPVKYISLRSDITRHKESERELLVAREEADRASRAKSEFLSRMSHELRTPMNAILGFAQLLEIEQSLSLEQKEYTNEILASGRHLLQLINGLLELPGLESEESPGRSEGVNSKGGS